MASELDRRMDAGFARLTGAGAPLALGEIAIDGRTLPVIAGAPATLPAYFAHWCGEHADKPFLVAGDERLTFAEVHAAAVRVAHALAGGAGVRRGERVGIAMRNSPAYVVLYMGVLIAGGVATLLNGWWQEAELAEAVREVGCRLVFADGARADRLAGAGAEIVRIDDRLPLTKALAPLGRHAPADAPPALNGDDLATILFTSGSTGQSKGAMSDHRAVVQATYNFLASALVMLGITTEDKTHSGLPHTTLLTLPLFHVTGMVPVLLQSFAMGRKLVLMTKWDAEEAMRLIERERATYFVGVPLMSFEILTHPHRNRYDLSTVADFAAGGAPRPIDHVRRIAAEMPGAPLIGYGLTETNAVGTGNWRANYLAKPSSAGRASPPLVELAILDDAGVALPKGARGEIAIRSVCNVRGYWQRPDATAAAFTADGFFRTGDIGYLDEDGYLFIVDRKKDILIRGGENIACQEVEAAIYQHPAVAECAVFGLADERLGEVPAAVVHYRDNPLDPDTLQRFVGERIAAFKVPARVWTSAEPLPRLGTEKIDKVALKARYRGGMAEG